MDVGYVIQCLSDFAGVYWLGKCIKTMICSLFAMGIILVIRIINHRIAGKFHIACSAKIDFYSMLLLFPMALTGMNKIFFLPGIAIINGFINVMKPIYGKVYFGVAALLLFRYIYRNNKLKKSVRKLESAPPFGRIEVYITDELVSPFSGGIIRPYIVLPRMMVEEWDQQQLAAVICHEVCHIKSGHIVWKTAFDLLKIYWWINPLIALCAKVFEQDMEKVCDETCMSCMGLTDYQYGSILMDMVELFHGNVNYGVLSFCRRSDFGALKSRVANLAGKNVDNSAKGRGFARIIAATVIAVTVGIIVTSYPRYTRLTETPIYNEDLELVVYDTPQLREAVTVKDGEVCINEEKFAQLLKDNHITGEYVYISFDTIMKIPGSGGGGNTAMVSTADYSDIFYLAADNFENKVIEFIFKYFI